MSQKGSTILSIGSQLSSWHFWVLLFGEHEANRAKPWFPDKATIIKVVPKTVEHAIRIFSNKNTAEHGTRVRGRSSSHVERVTVPTLVTFMASKWWWLRELRVSMVVKLNMEQHTSTSKSVCVAHMNRDNRKHFSFNPIIFFCYQSLEMLPISLDCFRFV